MPPPPSSSSSAIGRVGQSCRPPGLLTQLSFLLIYKALSSNRFAFIIRYVFFWAAIDLPLGGGERGSAAGGEALMDKNTITNSWEPRASSSWPLRIDAATDAGRL
eukprot:814359-Pyramimonas_sp.AAC.1